MKLFRFTIFMFIILVFLSANVAFAENYALQFDGNDEVVIPHHSSLSFSSTSHHTIELWFKYTGSLSIYHILGKRVGVTHSGMNYQIARDSNGLLHTNSCYDVVSAGVNPPQNEWLHMAVTYDGAILRIYLNGVLTVTTPFTYGCENTTSLKIGASGSYPGKFIGFIDEVRIWNVTRTEEEIATSYNRVVPLTTPGLVGYWNFDEDIDDQNVYDSSSFANNGTIGATLSPETDDPIRVLSDAPILVSNYDAAVVNITSPPDVVFYESVISPQVIVENLGLNTETILVTLQIGFDYNESTTITLDPGESGEVTFPQWQALELGSMPIQAFTSLSGDVAPFNDQLQKVIAITASSTSPVITKVSPDTGGNTGTVTVTIEGGNFQEGTEVKLSITGQPEIISKMVNVETQTVINAVFDLSGAIPGLWDIVVVNPNSEIGHFQNGFLIEVGKAPSILTQFLSRPVIRAGSNTKFIVVIENNGNVDLYGLSVLLGGIPNSAEANINFDLLYDPSPPWISDPLFGKRFISFEQEKAFAWVLPKLGVGQTLSFPFELTAHEGGSFTLQTFILPGASTPLLENSSDSGPVGDPSDCTIDSRDIEGLSKVADLMWEIFWNGNPLNLLRACAGAADEFAGYIDREVINPDSPLYGWLWAPVKNVCHHANLLIPKPVPGEPNRYYIVNTFPLPTIFPVELIGDHWEPCSEQGKWDSRLLCPLQDSSSAGTWSYSGDGICPPWEEDVSQQNIDVVQSLDPNEKAGASGYGMYHFILPNFPIIYAVFFENMESATAPAQDVTIEDQLDVETLDLSTFSLGEIVFGDNKIVPPPRLYEYNTEVYLRPDNNLIVNIYAKLDIFSGQLTWTFKSIDPDTGLPPEDPLAGFLPPNINPPEGEGHVLFSVKPKQNLATGTEVRNEATIVFDTNPPINTPEWLNTIDATIPESYVHSLAPTQNSTEFEVAWSGTDAGAGIRDYTIFVSDNGAPFTQWLLNTSDGSAIFAGQDDHTYAFYSVACDYVGNTEAAPSGPDTATTVTANLPPVANAGNDQTVSVDTACLASVALDGAASSDPDSDDLTFLWTWNGGTASGPAPVILLPLGTHEIVLVVNDGQIDSEPDSVIVTVVDATPPEVNITMTPDTLWPPNHKLVQVFPAITATDNCVSTVQITLESITINEADEINTYDPDYDSDDGDGNTTDDIVVDEDGNIFLRAERIGSNSYGRIYTITYKASDDSGNSQTATATVTVPHDLN